MAKKEAQASQINKSELSTTNPNQNKQQIQNQKLFEALQKDPDGKTLISAMNARKNNLFQTSRDLLQDLLNKRPEWEIARRELVMLYLSTENFTEAEKFLANETKRIPAEPWPWLMLANVYSKLKNSREEIVVLKKLIDIKFDVTMMLRLFELQKTTQDLEGALETVLKLRAHKDSLDLELANAKLLNLTNKKEEAAKLCEQIIDKSPEFPGAVEFWIALNLSEKNNPEALIKKFEPYLKKGLKNPSMYIALSRAFHRMENYEQALTYLNKAIEIDDKKSAWWYDLSLIQRQRGNVEESQASLLKAIEIEPLNPTALRVLGVEHKFTEDDKLLSHYHFAHANINLFPDEKKVEMYYALAKAFEDLNQLPTAFKHYENAGQLQTKLTPYRHSGSLGLLKMTRDRVSPITYENFKEPRSESEKAVFVLGMPRSGTTLAEQVIASHPDAFGAGELKLLHRVVDGVSINKRTIETKSESSVIPSFIPGIDLNKCRTMQFKERGEVYIEAIEALAKIGGKAEAKKIVDKMPGNYFWTGVIPFILPKAKIIHTQRHPLDNCISIYRIFFPDGMPWSYDLTNLGKVYRAYFEHMNYWEKNLAKDVMITMNYEIVVADFENQAKKIIHHVGLDWNDDCLKFYENERHVKTASLTQVRKPIYNTSVGRWKKYEDFLKPLIKELGPVIHQYDEMIQQKLDAIGKS